jgi:membrane protease YdiL (CAAX protease family)
VTLADAGQRLSNVSRTRLAVWVALVASISAIEYAARFSGGTAKSDRNEVYTYSGFASGLVFYGLIFFVVLAIAYGRSDLFALRRPPRNAALVAVGVLVAVYLCELVVSALPIRNPGKEQGLTPTHWEPSHAGAFAANLVLFTLIAPAVEELTFRGVGQSLLRFTGRWPSILLVGVAFGLWHGLVEALLVLIPFGVGLAYLRDRTSSVVPGIVVHGLFNGLALAVAVLS